MAEFTPRHIKGYRSTVINQIIDRLERSTPAKSVGTRVTETTRGTTIKTNGGQIIDEMDDFRIEIDGNTSVKVYKSTFRRNGIDIDLTCDAGQDYITITGLSTASTTYYIYLKLSATTANQDHSLKPEKLYLQYPEP